MNFELDTINIFVLFASVASLLYGMIVYSKNRTHPVNKTFFWFALTVGLWAFSMAVFRSQTEPQPLLYGAQFLYLSAALIAVAFAAFARAYMDPHQLTRRFLVGVSLPALLVIGMIAIPGFFIFDVTKNGTSEHFIHFHKLPHLIFFAYIVGYGVLSNLAMFAQALHVSKEERNRLLFIVISTSIPLMVSVVTNLWLPLLGVFTYNWVGQVSLFAMLTVMTYGMFRHHIFDAKVIATEFLMFVLWSLSIARVVLSETLGAMLFNVGALLVVSTVGLLLVRSVYREVESREEIERLAKNLTKANDQLRELDRQKSEFLSIAAHQLRTPLTAIKGYASLILEGSFGAVSSELKAPLETIFVSSTRMVETVADFLNVSKIEQGKMEYRMQRASLSELVQHVVKELEVTMKGKGLVLIYKDESQNGCMVTMDAGKVEHVISNIIDNSIKYTPQGSINVTLTCDEAAHVARVTIHDTGAGIPKEALGTLFDKFVRARNAKDINVTGSGLGLYVAREMMKAHGGTVTADSEGEGKGSTFVITLPLSLDTTASTQVRA
jgi:signal transduction histidine kinase